MADIRLISLLPTQSVTGVPPSTSSQGAASQGNATLGSLAPGTLVSGFILNRDASGNPVLRTPTGDITFSSNFFLKIGSEVTIRVESSAAGSLAHILTVDGQPPEIAETLSAFSDAPDVIVSQNLSSTGTQTQTAATNETQSAAPTLPAPSITVTGTLIAPAADQPQNDFTAGTQLTLKLTTLSQPAEPAPATAAPLPTAPTPNAASYTAYTRAAITPAATPIAPVADSPENAATPAPPPQATSTAQPPTIAAASSLPANNTPSAAPPVAPSPALPLPSSAIPSSVTTPPQATPQPAATTTSQPAVGQQVTATVIGNEVTGEAVLHSTAGMIRLQAGTSLPVGSQAQFEIMQVTLPQTAVLATAATPAPLTELAQHWTSLQQIFSLLAGRSGLVSTPTMGDPALDSPLSNALPWMPTGGAAMPSPTLAPQGISSGLMLFLSALRAGDFRSWLGSDNADWLSDRGHASLLQKAEGEFTAMAHQFTETEPHHWQALFFPVVTETGWQQVRLFVKRDRRENNRQQARKSEDTRFVVEVGLSQLGELQMDGFVRTGGQNIQFDLIIRSLTPLPDTMQQDIVQIYNDTGELTGYRGSLMFQPVKEFSVNPMEEIMAHAMNAVTA